MLPPVDTDAVKALVPLITQTQNLTQVHRSRQCLKGNAQAYSTGVGLVRSPAPHTNVVVVIVIVIVVVVVVVVVVAVIVVVIVIVVVVVVVAPLINLCIPWRKPPYPSAPLPTAAPLRT